MNSKMAGSPHTLVWYAGADGCVNVANPPWQEFTGQRFEDYEGWGWLQAIHADDRATVRQRWAEALEAGQAFTVNYRLLRANGEYREVVAQGAPVHDAGTLKQWVGFVVDTSEGIRAQAARQASEDRLRVLDEIGQATRHLQNADDIMASTACVLGKALGATRCAYADVDSDSNRFTIRSDWAVEGVPSSAGVYSLELFGPQATSNLRQGLHLIVNDVDAELGDEGGARMFNAIGIKAIICAGLVKENRLVAMMAVHQATARRWTDAEVLVVSEVVDRCWAHIERTRDAALLREQDARKDEFIATLAHELRNPLAPIKYAVAIASRRANDDVVASKLAVIDRQASLMARLIDDLLDISRISRGVIELRRQIVPLDMLVSNALEAAQVLLERQGHRVEMRVAPGMDVYADPARMIQVIGNLLTNAAKYTPVGGSIVVEAYTRGHRAVVSVTDSGYGMSLSDASRVFDMFTQLPHTKAHAQGGLGLGLSLVRKLMELHGGTAQVSSPGVGQGSTFRLELPLADPSPQSVERTAPELARATDTTDTTGDMNGAGGSADQARPGGRGAPLQGARVLVVEDNEDGREGLVAFLQGVGVEVEAASEGLQALKLAEQHRPEIVLLDLGLPGMDGYAVAQALRARHPPERMAIMALTGWGAGRDQERTRAAGFDAHLVKPVQPDALLRAIEAVMGRASSP